MNEETGSLMFHGEGTRNKQRRRKIDKSEADKMPETTILTFCEGKTEEKAYKH